MAAFLDAIDAELIDPERLAECVIDKLKIERKRKPEQRLRLTAREALQAVAFECLIVSTAAQNIANGMALQQRDLDRVLVAHLRIDRLVQGAIE